MCLGWQHRKIDCCAADKWLKECAFVPQHTKMLFDSSERQREYREICSQASTASEAGARIISGSFMSNRSNNAALCSHARSTYPAWTGGSGKRMLSRSGSARET